MVMVSILNFKFSGCVVFALLFGDTRLNSQIGETSTIGALYLYNYAHTKEEK